MINRFFWVLSFLLITLSASYAQQENVWVFGYNAGLDFNTGTATPITTSMNTQEACASVCSPGGQLLFYTNGEKVWDQTNNFMQNGFSISSVQVISTTQGALIVPMPDSSSKYYIFSLASIENGAGTWGKLYYSVVDMSLNNGLGAVVDGRKEILVDTGLQENMTAVAGKNCNIWLLTITQQGVLKAFNIDHNGINTVAVLSPVMPGSGTLPTPLPGSISVSPDRKKLAIADSALTLYDFNAATGTVSNPVILSGESFHYSVCFSSNSSKLYAIRFGFLGVKQFDLSQSTPAAIVNSLVALNPGVPPPASVKLAPDGKVYCFTNNQTMGVIHQPNLAGIACNYAPSSLPLNSLTNSKLGAPSVVPVIIPNGDTVFNTHIINVSECFTDTYLLQADTPGTGLVWDDGSTLPLRLISGAGTYWYTYTRHCVVYSDTFIVNFPNAAPLISIYASCKGSHNGAAVATPGDAGYNYTWRNASSTIVSTDDSLKHAAAGSYTLQVITPSGCDSTFVLYIPEEEHTASFQVDSIVCQESTVTFNNTSDIHFTQFDWTFGDGDMSSLQDPSHAYTGMGNYTAMLIARGAICIDTAFHTIIVDSILGGHYTTVTDSICTGQFITFYPDTDSTVQALQWFYGDGTGMTSTPDSFIRHGYDAAGTMVVTLTTEYRACPTSSFTDTVYIYPIPKIYLGPDSGLCLDGAPLLLENLWNDPNTAITNLWNTGDTTAALKVRQPGTYSLTVSSAPLGCSTTESVMVHKGCYVDIPNAFTPNGDGENDYFFPRQLLSRNITRFNMRIVNRWGQQIFETTRADGRGWDGRFNNNPQEQGVYIYLINLTIDNSKEEQYNGNVTLIR